MYNCQNSLITHLQKQFTAPAVNTLKAYAGDLREPAKLTAKLPAIFVLYIDGNPARQEADHQFELLIVTDSRILDKVQGKNANLQLSSLVLDYLKNNPLFLKQGGGSYYIMPEQISARTLAITDRHALIGITLYILDKSK